MLPRLAIGAAAGALAGGLLAAPMAEALDELRLARSAQAALAAAVAAAPAAPFVSAEQRLRAASRGEAVQRLAGRIRELAARSGVLVESIEAGGGAGLARLNLRLSGGESAVLGLADAIERGRPLARFGAWRVEPAAGGVRLTGELVAPWG